jgi:hypothetical protein
VQASSEMRRCSELTPAIRPRYLPKEVEWGTEVENDKDSWALWGQLAVME